jgi:hypothetical protein
VTAERGWKRPFDDPIQLPNGRQLVTLWDAALYITKLPKAEHKAAKWQAAMEALILVAELGGPTMFARIGVMRALNRHVERVFNPDRKRDALGTAEAGKGSIVPRGVRCRHAGNVQAMLCSIEAGGSNDLCCAGRPIFRGARILTDFKPKQIVPLGKRFSHVYRSRDEPTADSDRMRHRIANALVGYGGKFENYAEGELGITTPWSTSANWTACLKTWSLDDVLNVVTVLIEYVQARATGNHAKAEVTKHLVDKFNRIFDGENVSYRVDQQGGVHFLHDEEFVRNAQATIAGLGEARYANSLDRFESGMKAISGVTPDGKTGIRNVFEAAEGLFRVIFPQSARLTADQVALVGPILQKRYASDVTAARAASKLLASFKDWIEACHFYRHEPGKPDEIAQPPLEMAIHLMSVGAAFIRLMIETDEAESTAS